MSVDCGFPKKLVKSYFGSFSERTNHTSTAPNLVQNAAVLVRFGSEIFIICCFSTFFGTQNQPKTDYITISTLNCWQKSLFSCQNSYVVLVRMKKSCFGLSLGNKKKIKFSLGLLLGFGYHFSNRVWVPKRLGPTLGFRLPEHKTI